MKRCNLHRFPAILTVARISILSLFLLPADSLLVSYISPTIDTNSTGGDNSPYLHITADFGAQQPYNVTGKLSFLPEKVETACEALNKRNVAGKIVMVLRGGCNFIVKARNAVAAGAIGVVVGDNDPEARTLWKMINTEDARKVKGKGGKEGTRPETKETEGRKSIRTALDNIPFVFIQGRAYKEIKEKMKNATKDCEVWATLNQLEDIKYRKDPLYSHPRHPLMPFLWLMLGLSYWTRRLMAHYIARRRRNPAVAGIPMVHYVPLDSDLEAAQEASLLSAARHRQRHANRIGRESLQQLTSSSTVRHVINPTCTICFDDFTSGEQLKALPCRHGFHAPCIDPWLLQHSDKCPICNRSILDPPIPSSIMQPSSIETPAGSDVTASTGPIFGIQTRSNSQVALNSSQRTNHNNAVDAKTGRHEEPTLPSPRFRGRPSSWRGLISASTPLWFSQLVVGPNESSHSL
mmetsp:Transcript_2959/g.4278  ORF Transcript_2959/g.4278 Transcript_2959/m.4278 type:complete len:464 (-) Transcript_2959:149-1540(-)|eukprot:CAMPEP_0184490414 /NCGR_PEP_ID=MMETSP0113_2-20130426/17833_1 /TAXON_ID=91329 /ORGANISM="Norrisiella sphaerica, Strain BC52" /LENGTH=463 /DNA_ID=CAMNT_0026874287 /DNA_START=91 /DNA_END=1482 /DNA_ORIENTATION=+